MRLFILTFLFLGLVACKSKEKINENNSTKKEKTSELDDFISLNRTGCFGTCPMYKLVVYRNGMVEYSGRKYVENEGFYKAKLSKQQANDLFKKVDALNWDSFPEIYPIDNVDFPQFNVEIKLGNFTKSIRGNTRADQALLDLTTYMDTLFKTLELEKMEDKKEE